MKLSCKLCRLLDCPRAPDAHWHVRDEYIGVIFSASTLVQCSNWIHQVFLPVLADAKRKREATAKRPAPASSAPVSRVAPIKTTVRQLEPAPAPAPQNTAIEEVASALANLGMRRAEAQKYVAEIAQAHPGVGFDELFKACMSSKAK